MATKKKRRNFTAKFKSKIALESLKDSVSVSEMSKRYELHPNQISKWKKSLETNSHRIFEGSHPEKDERDRLIEKQNREIDILTLDLNFLKKKLKPYL